jgi:predicted permease
MQELWKDCRLALRRLLHRRLLATGAILVLAIGIGPVTAYFTLVNAVFLRPWQVLDPGSLGVIRAKPAGGEVVGAISIAEYRYFREQATTAARLAVSIPASSTIAEHSGQGFAVQPAYVNADYFDALGIRMAAGRSFVATEEDYGAPSPVAIISDRLWHVRFGRDPSVLGARVSIVGLPYQVVGVAESRFGGVESPGPVGTDLWLPLPTFALRGAGVPNLAGFSSPRAYTVRNFAIRLRSGVTRESAAAELSLLSKRFRESFSFPSNGIEVIDTRPLSSWPPGVLLDLLRVQTPLAVAVILVFLTACANVGNLLLADTVSRERDMAIRLSLGASRWRVVRQLLAECGMISASAGVLGLALAYAVPRVMLSAGFAFGVGGFERLSSPIVAEMLRPSFYTPELVVWFVAAVIATTAALLGVLASAWRVRRIGITSLAATRYGRSRERASLRRWLLSAQVSASMVLLVAAASLTRATTDVDLLSPGFRIADVQVIAVQVGPSVQAQPARTKAFLRALSGALHEAGVGSFAFSERAPFSSMELVLMLRRPDEAPSASRPIPLRRVSRNYFGTLGIPLVQGRAPDSDVVLDEVVVNESAAGTFWPGEDPVGASILSSLSRTRSEALRVVGVAKDTPVGSMSDVGPVVYRTPSWVTPTTHLFVTGATQAVTDQVRAVAGSIEPDVQLTARPLRDFVMDALGPALLASRWAWGIGILALVLAAVGAFGVFCNDVEERRYEIGVRRAVGATGFNVAVVLVRAALPPLFWGLGAGLALALLIVPVLRHFLFGLSRFDAIAYGQVGAVLGVATLVAMWIPIRRAIAVDPATILRGD